MVGFPHRAFLVLAGLDGLLDDIPAFEDVRN